MQYGYHAILCGKERRGVCLLINQDLEPWIRKEMKTDKDGRMVGMVLEIKGERIVVVNVYMPTGLDFVGSDDEKMEDLVSKMYKRLEKWSELGKHQIILGDFNETISPLDRLNPSPKYGRWISELTSVGMMDSYRTLNPFTPGYTHFIEGNLREVKSRLDYIFIGGWSRESLRKCYVDNNLVVSHHRLLILELDAGVDLKIDGERADFSIPNVRNATSEQKESLVKVMEEKVLANSTFLKAKSIGDRADVDEMVECLSRLAFESAEST